MRDSYQMINGEVVVEDQGRQVQMQVLWSTGEIVTDIARETGTGTGTDTEIPATHIAIATNTQTKTEIARGSAPILIVDYHHEIILALVLARPTLQRAGNTRAHGLPSRGRDAMSRTIETEIEIDSATGTEGEMAIVIVIDTEIAVGIGDVTSRHDMTRYIEIHDKPYRYQNTVVIKV